MFTGLVEGIGRIDEVTRIGQDTVLGVLPLFNMSEPKVGDSISVNGVCLTVTGMKGKAFHVYVSSETISLSTMGQLRKGDEVNLERALLPTDRLGGHMVSGHVDGMGKILKKEQKQRSWLLRVEIDKALMKYTIEKGSIAIDGISLTINHCQDTYFEVNIIPQTGKETTLLKKRVGDTVNIETDLIGKYVEKFVVNERLTRDDKSKSSVDRAMLRKYGFDTQEP